MRILLLLIGIVSLLWGTAESWLDRPPAPPPPLQSQVSRIVIDKSDRLMTVYAGTRALKSYPIALGFAPQGEKTRQGDGKTPEGEFVINRRNPQSKYHLSLGIDYPRRQDITRAQAQGVNPGGDIFIHGQPASVPAGHIIAGDWTAGCIAVSNTAIRELWEHVAIGTQVVIRP